MLQQNFTTTAAFTLYHKRISGASLSIHDFSTRRTRNWWKTALALNGRLRNTQNTHSSPNVSPHFPSKSLHSDPKLPFTAARTSGVNPRESTFGRRLIITRTGQTRGGGGGGCGAGNGFTTFRVRFDHLCVCPNLTCSHSPRALCCSPANFTIPQSRIQTAHTKLKSPNKKKSKSARRAVCNGGRATSHSLHFLLTF